MKGRTLGGIRRPGWLIDLALALSAEPDLRPGDPAFARAVVEHSPCEHARVWVRRDEAMVAVSQHPERPVAPRVQAAVTEHPEAPISVAGVMLFPLPEIGVLEVTGALGFSDIDGLAMIAASFAERVRNTNLLDSVVESMPDMVFVKDAQHLRFVLLNRAGEELLGLNRSDLIGRSDHDFFSEEEADFFTANDHAVLESGEPLDIPEESLHTSKGARLLHTRKIPIKGVDGQPRYLLGISRDITERTQIERRLLQSQKLEAVVQLAAGLAHDFNNAAMVISGYADIAIDKVESDPPRVRTFLEKLRRASHRITKLADRLLGFARTRVATPVVTDLGLLVEEGVHLLRPLVSEAITLETGGIHQGCFAAVDRSQLEQVLINLAVNARDAMPEGGTLTISVEGDIDPGELSGRWVELSVADDGRGMDSEVLTRACEPFFTTKRDRGGSGLGLYSANQIVGIHGGHMSIESAEGAGTTVRIMLPAVEASVSAAESPRRPTPVIQPGKGEETVLLVEDDEDVRAVLAGCLEAHGYDVLLASDGADALELIDGLDAEPIDLLLSDVVMPRMGGAELAKRIRSARPSLPVILMSGYTDQADQLAGDPRLVFLRKPIETDSLIATVRSVLDG